jgi:5-methylcytosine-specific restriction endonuclease McrA
MATNAEKLIVRKRAHYRCEYCQAPEEITGYTFHIEHIYPRNRDGKNKLANYALACMPCNRWKSDYSTGKDPITGKQERLFHPRKDKWSDHFHVERRIWVKGKTAIGRATENRLQMNQPRQLEARKLWLDLNLYP